MNFSFATATQIVFGEGVARKLGHFASEKGQRVLLVTGKNSERSQFVVEQFSKKGFEQSTDSMDIIPLGRVQINTVKILKKWVKLFCMHAILCNNH